MFSTLFGGANGDGPSAVALDSGNNLYVAGTTSSTNFPVTTGTFQAAYGGGNWDGFIAKFNRAAFTTLSPKVVVCTPANGATVINGFQVAGTLQSGYQARWVAVYVDGVNTFQESGMNTVEPHITESAGTHQVMIKGQNAAGSLFSSTVTIKINSNPKPGISSITPSSAVAGGPAFTLSLQGLRFVPASIVQWNGSPRSTRFIQNNLGGYLQAGILASDIAHSGTAQVTVVNPAPGGGVSNAVTFTISP